MAITSTTRMPGIRGHGFLPRLFTDLYATPADAAARTLRAASPRCSRRPCPPASSSRRSGAASHRRGRDCGSTTGTRRSCVRLSTAQGHESDRAAVSQPCSGRLRLGNVPSMKSREVGRRAYVVVLIAVAVGCVVLGIAVANLAWDWWGEPCNCSDLGRLGPLGTFCSDTCISVGPMSVSQAWGAPLLLLALPALGSALAGSLMQRAERASAPED